MKLKIKLDDVYLDELGFNISPTYVIGAPEPKTFSVDVPFANGSIDLTESLTGGVSFRDRSITFELQKLRPKNTWQSSYHNLLNLFQGKKVRIQMPYDDDHYFLGRIKFNELTRGDYMSVACSAIVEPYRYKNLLTTQTFDVDTNQTVYVIPNESMLTVPTITTDQALFIKQGTTQWSVNAGTHKLALILQKGDNEITLQNLASGTAQVTFEYQEGAL